MSGHGSPLPPLRLAGFTAEERASIGRAYGLAAHCHEGQLRKSGEPYIVHPVAVAEIAIEVGMDCAGVCAALLHDVIDSGCDASRLRTEFGDEIAALVQGVMDFDRGHDQGFVDAGDERRIALKVLDRLHNMRTLQYLDQEKQRRKSRETLELIAPLAGRLGMDAVAVELESIARNYLSPLNGASYQALALRWIMRSDLRTWTPLTALLGWMTVETAENSLGDAVAILITVPPVLHAGVTQLRTKLGLDRSEERR